MAIDDEYEGVEERRVRPNHVDKYARKMVVVLREEMDIVKTNVSSFTIALFGHPQDKSDSGIVGNVSETRDQLEKLNSKVDKIVWGLFTMAITGIGAVVVAIIEVAAKHN